MDSSLGRAKNLNERISPKHKDFMIHVLNNLPKEYDVILNGLENRLMATGDDALTIDSISKKLNHG